MKDKIKKMVTEIIWTEICAGYTYPQIARFYEISPQHIARIAYGNGFSVEIALKVLEKHGYDIIITR